MDEAEATRFWCHMCNQRVSPIMEVEEIKCPVCQSGFVEEMVSAAAAGGGGNDSPLDFGGGFESRNLSLWAPILLEMMSNHHRHRRVRRLGFDDDHEGNNEFRSRYHHGGEDEIYLDRELESTLRRRSSPASILQLLHGIRTGVSSGSENPQSDSRERDREHGEIELGERERVILINPFNQTIIVQGSLDANGNSQTLPFRSLGDYFIGPGLESLLQHLAENDPNRYGTPPAQKEAVEALPTVEVEETLQCSVCLDDFEMGTLAREMPCKHKFHDSCILPWLELHSSCPVCRYQLPADESKVAAPGDARGGHNHDITSENNDANSDSNRQEGEGGGNARNENEGRFSLPFPWPFSSLFSSSGSQSGNPNSTSPTSSEPSTNAPAPGTRAHED